MANQEDPASVADSKKHNDVVFSYYENHCKNPQSLLKEIQALPNPSATNIYNQAVLNYYDENFGRTVALLKPLYSSLDSLTDYLSIKTCFLLLQAHISLGNTRNLEQILDALTEVWTGNPVLKEQPETTHFCSLMLGTWMGSPDQIELSQAEFSSIYHFFKSIYYLMIGEGDTAKQLLGTAEEAWKRIDRAHFSPDIFGHMETQFLAAKCYIHGEIAYMEGNMSLALQCLNQGQLEILPTLKDLKSHPSCLRTSKKISHPVFFYNNLGCIHIRLRKPRLARLYFSKAYETFSNKQSIDTKSKNNTISYYSSIRRAELLYNSALALLLSNKPEKALDCLKEISGLYRTRAVFWYRMAQCYSCIYQRELEKGRLNMVSDVVVSEQRQKLYLPAKAVYKFQEQEEPEKEDPIEQATKCLRNALSFCDDQELRVYILLLLSYICMNKQR